MRVNCEIAQINTLKKGMKIVLSIGEKETYSVMKQIYNFMDKPLIVDFSIDGEEQQARLNQISPEQRKKIYALFRDIASYTGNTPEDIKETLKYHFVRETEYEPFSLSNCSWKLASDFIEWLINFCFENGIPLTEHPLRTLDDIEKYVRICLKNKICTICGKPGEIHHCTGSRIGMGRNRDKINNKGEKVISLCRTHHNEIHTMPEEEFFEKYHVHGIVYEE